MLVCRTKVAADACRGRRVNRPCDAHVIEASLKSCRFVWDAHACNWLLHLMVKPSVSTVWIPSCAQLIKCAGGFLQSCPRRGYYYPICDCTVTAVETCATAARSCHHTTSSHSFWCTHSLTT